MTTTLQPPPLSPCDLLRLEHDASLELIEGEIVEKPVSIESSRIEMRIGSLLVIEANKQNAAAVFGSSMGYKCFAEDPAGFRRPDVSVVRAERMEGIDSSRGFMPISADLVVEVISPNESAYDVEAKTQLYLRNGFPLVWLVYPNTRTIIVRRADGSTDTYDEDDEITGGEVLPEFRCKASELFGVG